MKMSPVEKGRLQEAYNEYVGRYGRNAAIDAVESASGTMFVTEVNADKVAATLAALAKPPLVARGKVPLRPSHYDRSISVHDTLDAMAKSIYSRRSS